MELFYAIVRFVHSHAIVASDRKKPPNINERRKLANNAASFRAILETNVDLG